jgi:hypothetical protein
MFKENLSVLEYFSQKPFISSDFTQTLTKTCLNEIMCVNTISDSKNTPLENVPSANNKQLVFSLENIIS